MCSRHDAQVALLREIACGGLLWWQVPLYHLAILADLSRQRR